MHTHTTICCCVAKRVYKLQFCNGHKKRMYAAETVQRQTPHSDTVMYKEFGK